jgi:hypothetical protein
MLLGSRQRQPERFVPLPNKTLLQLRELWRTHRSPQWLFLR